MDNLELLQFHPAHVEVAELTDHEAKNFARLPGAFQKMIDLNQKSIQAVTVMHDGRIMLMCGFIALWPGVVEAWLIPTKRIEENPIEFCKTIRKFLAQSAEVMNIRRMQASAIADERHTKFMEFLGFEREGLLKEYSDAKEDFIPWARFFPERSS